MKTKDYFGISLCEKCPDTEFFLVHIFQYLDWIRRFTKQIYVFSADTGKYGPEETPYLDTFHAVHSFFISIRVNWVEAQYA